MKGSPDPIGGLAERVLEAAPDAMLVVDGGGRIVFVNGQGEALFGWSRRELCGQTVEVLVPERARGNHPGQRAAYASVPRARPMGQRLDVTARRRDGREVPVEIALSTVPSSAGEKLIVAVVRDVSDRRQADEERRRLEERLGVSDRLAMMGTLAAGVAHEINNPLMVVTANVESLVARLGHAVTGKHAWTTSEILESLHEMRDAAARVTHIVRDLKGLSRGDEERIGPTNLHDAIESALRLAGHEVRHCARVVRDFGTVPPVLGNAVRLGQVLLNLIVNAAQAMDTEAADRNELRVTTRLAGDDRVAVEVSDTGCGIAPERLPLIFEPFFTTKPTGVGTGLGLAVCRRIVTSLGGEITVTSTPGRGTTFRVLLSVAQPPHPTSDRPPTVVSRAPVRGRVLVVDDDVTVHAALARALSCEHEVSTVVSPEAALDLLRRGARFDVVLCDISRPQMIGVALYEAVAVIEPRLASRMVFMVGGAPPPSVRDFLGDPARLVVEKPIDFDDLRRIIAAQVRA